MPSLFKDLGDETFPGHTLKVYEDEYGYHHLSCNWFTCDWEAVEIDDNEIPNSWFRKHYLYAFFQEDPLAFLKELRDIEED